MIYVRSRGYFGVVSERECTKMTGSDFRKSDFISNIEHDGVTLEIVRFKILVFLHFSKLF